MTTDHAAFALGVARRALDEIALQAGSYQRGYLTDPIAHRGALQHDLGKCDQQLRAARALCRESLEDAWEFCQRQERPDLERQLRLRGAAPTLPTLPARWRRRRFVTGEATPSTTTGCCNGV